MNTFGIDLDAYQGRSLLVTGALGFMGLHLSLALHKAGARVRLLDIARPELDECLDPTLGKMEFIQADLRDGSQIEAAVQGCDIIFNLAGRSGAVASNDAPFEDLDVNCHGHLTLLEACRKCNPHVKIVFPSSRLVYAPNLPLPVAETASTEPLSIYGIHKLTAEKYHLLYAHLYGLRVTVLRITNPYGPFQHSERRSYGIINWIIHQALSGQTIPIYGSGQQVRDYLHINDLVRVFLLSGVDERATNRLFNVGSGEGTRFIDMARMIVELVGHGIIEHVPWPSLARQVESGDFVADNHLIKGTLGWQPQIALAQGLKRVIAHYRDTTSESDNTVSNASRDEQAEIVERPTHPSSKLESLALKGI